MRAKCNSGGKVERRREREGGEEEGRCGVWGEKETSMTEIRN